MDMIALAALAAGLLIGGIIAFVFALLYYRNQGEKIKFEIAGEKDALKANLETANKQIQQSMDRIWELEGSLSEQTRIYQLLKVEEAKLSAVLEQDSKRSDELRQQILELEARHHEQTGLVKTLSVEKAELETKLLDEQKNSEDKLRALVEAQESLKDSFSTLSIEALRQNTEAFTKNAEKVLKSYQEMASGDLQQRQEGIKNLVEPVKEQLEKVREFVHQVEKERGTAYSELKEQFKQMSESQGELRSTASKLVQVLSNTKSRGQWGEIQLKRIVELAGMTAFCDFDEQVHTRTEQGGQRPDLVVRLPGERMIVIDAKAPMDAFLEAHDAEDDLQRNGLFKKHATSVRSHVGMLKSKGYQDNFAQSPEFVVLFLPNEAVYSTALEHDPKLIEDGAVDNVIIATPTTLIALLKAVAYGWRQEKIADEVKKFSEIGREFYERLATVTKHITGVGTSLGKTVRDYNKMIGSIEGRLIPTAKKFHDSNLVGDSRKALEEPLRIDSNVRELNELTSLEDPDVLREDLEGIAEDFEENFGKLRIADAAGGSGD